MVGGAVATVVIFDVTDAMSTAGGDIFEDGFRSGDVSAWSSFVSQGACGAEADETTRPRQHAEGPLHH